VTIETSILIEVEVVGDVENNGSGLTGAYAAWRSRPRNAFR
jgi:hypothetical protein